MRTAWWKKFSICKMILFYSMYSWFRCSIAIYICDIWEQVSVQLHQPYRCNSRPTCRQMADRQFKYLLRHQCLIQRDWFRFQHIFWWICNQDKLADVKSDHMKDISAQMTAHKLAMDMAIREADSARESQLADLEREHSSQMVISLHSCIETTRPCTSPYG